MPTTTVLVLCHRIPYPANKGDKIRNYHLITELGKYANVVLGCFIDDDFDNQYTSQLAAFVQRCVALPLSKRRRCFNAVKALLRGTSVTEAYYEHPAMHQWVAQQLAHVDHVLVTSSAMARYIPETFLKTKIIDFVDYDSAKWAFYAQSHRWPMRWLYQREATLLARYEQQLVHVFDKSYFVSRSEASQFCQRLAVQQQSRVSAFNNGVDTDHYDPALFSQAQRMEPGCVVFTGEMNYPPNVDAVCWFVRDVLALIKSSVRFYIVGRNPTAEVLALSNEHVIVTGRVDDVRPYLARAQLVVAPMLFARGVKNKVLEAMAMAKPIVGTHAAFHGLETLCHGEQVKIADTATAFAHACDELLQRPCQLVQSHRQLIEANFSWQRAVAPLISDLIPPLDGSNL